MKQKICTKCGVEKGVDAFALERRGRFGVSSKCKICEKEYAAAYYIKNKKRINAMNKLWSEGNSSKFLEYTRRYRESNPEKFFESRRKSAAAWREKNLEKSRELCRQYQKANPHVSAANAAARQHHIKLATPSWANKHFIAEAYHIAKVREQMLGGKWHVDHVIPLRGKRVCGLHVENNLQVVRAETNLRKGNKLLEEYLS